MTWKAHDTLPAFRSSCLDPDSGLSSAGSYRAIFQSIWSSFDFLSIIFLFDSNLLQSSSLRSGLHRILWNEKKKKKKAFDRYCCFSWWRYRYGREERMPFRDWCGYFWAVYSLYRPPGWKIVFSSPRPTINKNTYNNSVIKKPFLNIKCETLFYLAVCFA